MAFDRIRNEPHCSKRVLSVTAAVVVVSMFALMPARSVLAQATASDQQGSGESFPGGVTPSDVFSRLELVDRCLDRLITEREIKPPELPPRMETQLGPLHVYQMVLACSLRVQELGDQAEALAVPTLSAKPRFYTPQDVLLVVGLMLDGVQRAAQNFQVDLPADETPAREKTPTDVFELAGSVFIKLNALCGYDEISSNESYAEMVRAAEDVRSVLRQADPESRYRVDAPPGESGLLPEDVFEKCMDIRRLLNQSRGAYGLAEVPLPSPPGDYEISSHDVFLQTQIVIAELNLLKLRTGTISSTPLAIPVKKTMLATDVFDQASLIEYLLRQVNSETDRTDKANK